MKIGSYHRHNVPAAQKATPLKQFDARNKGIKADWRAEKRAEAEERQAAYDAAFPTSLPSSVIDATGGPSSVRPGRKLRDGEL